MKKILMSLLVLMTASASYAEPAACPDANTFSTSVDAVTAVLKLKNYLPNATVKTESISLGSIADATKLPVTYESNGQSSEVALGAAYVEMTKDKLADLYLVSKRNISCQTKGYPGVFEISCVVAKN
ncbi:MAG: hypothetical protein ACXVCP_16410 [Bdellovibrio sp.]